MPVLKDMHCDRCGNAREELVDSDITSALLLCDRCATVRPHISRCTGGQKLKCYAGSYDGRDWSGDIEYMGAVAENADGTAVHEQRGLGPRTDAAFNNDAKARIAEKRDKLSSDSRRKLGRENLFIDQKRHVAAKGSK